MRQFYLFLALILINTNALLSQTTSTETAKNLNNLEEESEQPNFFIQESDEDIINFVDDFIKKDIQLKGSFLIEDVSANKILKLKFESISKTLITKEDGTKSVETFFKDSQGKKYTIIFHLIGVQWGGIDIFKIELKQKAKKRKKE